MRWPANGMPKPGGDATLGAGIGTTNAPPLESTESGAGLGVIRGEFFRIVNILQVMVDTDARRSVPAYAKSEATGIAAPGRPSTSTTPEGSTLVTNLYLPPLGLRWTSTPSVVRWLERNGFGLLTRCAGLRFPERFRRRLQLECGLSRRPLHVATEVATTAVTAPQSRTAGCRNRRDDEYPGVSSRPSRQRQFGA